MLGKVGSVLVREVLTMTLTVLDPRTGKRVTITVPDEPSRPTQPRSASNVGERHGWSVLGCVRSGGFVANGTAWSNSAASVLPKAEHADAARL